MPSFDIVSKTDLAEAKNAIDNVTREMETRYDFKGSKSKVAIADAVITIDADDDLKLRQVHELIKAHMTRRKIDAGVLDFRTPEKAAGQAVRQQVAIRQGIDTDTAKKIVKDIKAAKLKVQAAIQGDELRITGKKRDDLQAAIAHVKGLKIELPLQYVNFRD